MSAVTERTITDEDVLAAAEKVIYAIDEIDEYFLDTTANLETIAPLHAVAIQKIRHWEWVMAKYLEGQG